MTSGTNACTVKYDQGGNGNYNAATQKTESVNAVKADQTITITTPAPASKVFGQLHGRCDWWRLGDRGQLRQHWWLLEHR